MNRSTEVVLFGVAVLLSAFLAVFLFRSLPVLPVDSAYTVAYRERSAPLLYTLVSSLVAFPLFAWIGTMRAPAARLLNVLFCLLAIFLSHILLSSMVLNLGAGAVPADQPVTLPLHVIPLMIFAFVAISWWVTGIGGKKRKPAAAAA